MKKFLSYEEMVSVLKENEELKYHPNFDRLIQEFETKYVESNGSSELGREIYKELGYGIEMAIVSFGIGEEDEEGNYDSYEYKYLLREA